MNQINKTITTLEIAEMMGISHSDILRKLDGRKDRKGYVQILGDHQMAVSKYFIKSSYLSEQNKELPCYEVTKLGCDFLANKFTGEKGILFTAQYVERFNEMEQANPQVAITDKPGEVANLISVLSRLMKNQGSAPCKIAENAKLICEQYGIRVSTDFVKVSQYEQMSLPFTNINKQ